MIDLSGRRVLVTGGSRGIGAATCRLFAACGTAVAVHYRERGDRARAVVASLGGEGPHLALAGDLADSEECAAVIRRVETLWGGLDVLVNNAGIWEPTPLGSLDPQVLERTWRLNQRAVFLCAHHALPLLRRSAHACIINVSSTAGQRGEAGYSAYAASKGALIAATKSWSSELAPHIRVNAVAPGWVDTEMCAETFAAGGREAVAATIPLGRVAEPEDLAGPIVFLASDWARHITGEVLNVNGGSVLAG